MTLKLFTARSVKPNLFQTFMLVAVLVGFLVSVFKLPTAPPHIRFACTVIDMVQLFSVFAILLNGRKWIRWAMPAYISSVLFQVVLYNEIGETNRILRVVLAGIFVIVFVLTWHHRRKTGW